MQTVLMILFLVFLEGVLSFDNALALAAMVQHLPKAQQKKALTYGICGAFLFRFISLFFVVHLLESPWMRILGGLYLVWLCVSSLRKQDNDDSKKTASQTLWRAIVLVELTDIIFSVDSILASAAVSQTFWMILTGGILGIIMMRFVSGLFIRLIEIFPRLEKSAFIMIGIVGVKLLVQAQSFYPVDVEHGLYAYILWTLILSAVGYGFTKKRTMKLFVA